MDEKLPSKGIRPVFPSHPHQTVIGYPVSANTQQPIQSRRPATSASAAIEDSYRDPNNWFIIWLIFVVLVSVFSTVIIIDNVPEFPSISIKSMSMTTITNASDTQVKARLEMVFDPVENINKHNSIIYDSVNVTAFDVKEGLFSDATFEQRGSDKRAVVVRMENVTVDVSEYEQHIYGRYGVSYLNFEIAGFIRIEGGKWPVKRTTSIRAGCDQVSKKKYMSLFVLENLIFEWYLIILVLVIKLFSSPNL
ncbi:hypothetical protein FNV43_RR10821 [Rhamnella rubrinervis]|uniref:Uncharacterized protein n=1 Tax=Rhamnella rubrinervis TaxID=2594499 RepID=A0A8K0H4M6_9ROSA|nr:hypothetical protein FNV43_RR10821 [Rhamnella rubrinervis]